MPLTHCRWWPHGGSDAPIATILHRYRYLVPFAARVRWLDPFVPIGGIQCRLRYNPLRCCCLPPTYTVRGGNAPPRCVRPTLVAHVACTDADPSPCPQAQAPFAPFRMLEQSPPRVCTKQSRGCELWLRGSRGCVSHDAQALMLHQQTVMCLVAGRDCMTKARFNGMCGCAPCGLAVAWFAKPSDRGRRMHGSTMAFGDTVACGIPDCG